MSAYGPVKLSSSSSTILPSTVWAASPKNGPLEAITIHHLRLESAKALPGLVEYLHSVFQQTLDEGRTYPQEGEMGLEAFEAYYFAESVFVALKSRVVEAEGLVDGGETEAGVLDVKGARNWEDAVAGVYYVKPNYPGRSSHICNAGFVVPSKNGGKGYGKALGKSYLHYGPKLGYQGSVFNLVYVNNIASVRIWESLGFTKAGRIPSAGRLKKKEEDEEEYVDAWIFHKTF